MKQKILFISEGQLGDLLILTPALRGMKKSFPDSELSVMIVQRRFYSDREVVSTNVININPDKGTSLVLKNNPYVDKIFEINRETLRNVTGFSRLQAEWRIISYLRKEKYNTVICTFPEDRFTIWAYLSGAKNRIGQRKQGLSWLLNGKPDIIKEHVGVLQYYCALASDAGAQIDSIDTEYYINKESQLWADDFLAQRGIDKQSKVICIHPGASGDYKIWPPERFAAVYDQLQLLENTIVLLSASRFDEQVLSEVKKQIKTKLIFVDDSGSIDRFAAILNRCDICLCNDSGPRHLAIAVGTPTISIMSRKNHLAWNIYDDEKNIVLQGRSTCEKCIEDDCREIIPDGEPFGAWCVRKINVDRVMQLVKDKLLI